MWVTVVNIIIIPLRSQCLVEMFVDKMMMMLVSEEMELSVY